MLVDVSGNQDVVGAVHAPVGRRARPLADRRRHPLGPASRPPTDGPRRVRSPTFFFAPSQVTKRTRDWGAEVLAVAWPTRGAGYADWVAGWLTLEHAAGPDAVIEVFRTYLSGRVDPRVGTICTLATEEVPA